MDTGSLMIVMIVLFMASCVWVFLSEKKKKNIKTGHNWYKDMLLKENIKDDIDEAIVLGFSNNNDFLIYTNRDYVYVVNIFKRVFEKVDKKDILNIDVQIYHSEKNVKRLVALTSTFDKSIIVSDITFKFMTRSKVYNVPCMISGRDNNGNVYRNRNTAVDDVRRIKLLIEDDILKLNNANI